MTELAEPWGEARARGNNSPEPRCELKVYARTRTNLWCTAVMNALTKRDRRHMRKYLNARFGPGQACVNRQGQVLIRRDIGNADQAGWDILGDCRDFMREVEVSSSGSTRGHAARRLNTRNNQSSPSKIEPEFR
jgi:hypothetical protein